MEKTMRGLFWLLLVAGALVAVLAAANRLPSLMQEGSARRFDGIEEAKRSLGLENVQIPAYFPEGISWPPSLVVAQKKPFKAIVMEFGKSESSQTAMIVIQSAPYGSDAQLQKIRLSEVRETTEYPLKGKRVLLQVGTCDNGMPCSRMSWQEGGLRCTVLLMSSPFELIKIAESMIR